MCSGAEFFNERGLTDVKPLMELCLRLSEAYNTPVNYWLNLPVDELIEWLEVAEVLSDKQEKEMKRNKK